MEKTKEEIIYPFKQYLAYSEVPDYLSNVVTIEDCKKVMGLWATMQATSQSSVIKEQAERIEKLEAALRKIEKNTSYVATNIYKDHISNSVQITTIHTIAYNALIK